MRMAGAILAGGKARRLGGKIAKGAIEVAPGVTIVDRLIRELDITGYVARLYGTASNILGLTPFAKDTLAMGIIHHQDGVEFLSHGIDFVQGSDITIHTEHPIRDNQSPIVL